MNSKNQRLLDHFREQAGWCRDIGSHFMFELCERFAADFEAGGPVADLVADWPGSARRDAVALRLAGALHHAVLDGSTPELGALYPDHRALENGWDIESLWPCARDWLSAHRDEVSSFLLRAPQTNETRRSICLMSGFLQLAHEYDMPMHVLELGASAGLNMNWDRFNYRTGSWSLDGDSDVAIDTVWHVSPPPLETRPRVRSRGACDLNPLDIMDDAMVTRLRAYIWPDQPGRMTRFDAAVALARETGHRPVQASASDWLARELANQPRDALTVVYHSVFYAYPSGEERGELRRLIEQAGAEATPDAPFAWLCFEPEAVFSDFPNPGRMLTRCQTWPGGKAKILHASNGHVTEVVAF